MAHTPGPWFADLRTGMFAIFPASEPRRECLSGSADIAIVHQAGRGDVSSVGAFRYLTEEQIANARLIAAAPALLALAKRARDILRYLHGLEIANRDCVWEADYTDEINDLDAAIAEAEGRDG